MKKLLFLLVAILMLAACDSTKDQVITRENLEATSAKLKGKLDSRNDIALEHLLNISKGRTAFIEGTFKNAAHVFEDKIIAEEAFNKQADALFSYLTEKQVTYKQFLDEMEAERSIQDAHAVRMAAVQKQIDSLCILKQRAVAQQENKASQIKDSLHNMVAARIIMMTEMKLKNRDVIMMGIQLVNQTKTPIEGVELEFPLKHDGTLIGPQRVKLMERFTESYIGRTIYDLEDMGHLGPLLLSMSRSQDFFGLEVVKLTIGGKTLEAYSERDRVFDHHYETPEELKGECPYLEADHALIRIVEAGDKPMRAEIREKYPIAGKLQDAITGIFGLPVE